MNLREEVVSGNKRAIARLISMVENGELEGMEIINSISHFQTKPVIIGITGPPGAGKSTLTDQLTKHILKEGSKVGIIAVDPSSPITGGALLGDRIRMSDLNREPTVYIRSMATRGALGGLSKAVRDGIAVLTMAGFEYIFVETVGVGQSEVEIMHIADVVVLVMVPGLGDDIQASKAGIMEIANVILVNKADHPLAERTAEQIHSMISLHSPAKGIPVEVVKTIATTGEGVDIAFATIMKYYNRVKGE